MATAGCRGAMVGGGITEADATEAAPRLVGGAETGEGETRPIDGAAEPRAGLKKLCGSSPEAGRAWKPSPMRDCRRASASGLTGRPSGCRASAGGASGASGSD
nr:hypothetical protein GCM10020092_085660 [Actinoplanes digitatis]